MTVEADQIFHTHGRPQTFFQGRAKFSRGWGKNILFSSKKSQKLTILAGQGGSRAPSCPPLRTPMECKCVCACKNANLKVHLNLI